MGLAIIEAVVDELEVVSERDGRAWHARTDDGSASLPVVTGA